MIVLRGLASLSLLVLFSTLNTNTCFAKDAEFNTISEALNYSGDRAAITKLIITGEIYGDDYSSTSDWSKFLTLDETFTNLSAVEIRTSQDIPNGFSEEMRGLFVELESWDNHIPQGRWADWLTSFSAPNVKRIGDFSFPFLGNLSTVNFPSATEIGRGTFLESGLVSAHFPQVATIEVGAFMGCESLISVDFPLVTSVHNAVFHLTPKLSTVSLGTGFETPTEIEVSQFVFGVPEQTWMMDLILGENVLPLPDLGVNSWQTTNHPDLDVPYFWNSIYIKKVSVEETLQKLAVRIFPNPTRGNATVSFELASAGNLRVLLLDLSGQELLTVFDDFVNAGLFTKTTNTEHLIPGVYFFNIFIEGKLTVEKLIVE